MDGLLILLILAVLAIPVSILVLFVKMAGLRADLRAMEAQVKMLRAGQGVPTAAAIPTPVDPEPLPPALAPTPEPVAQTPLAAVTPWDRALGKAASEPPPATAPAAKAPAAKAPIPPRGPSGSTKLVAWLQANWIYAVSAASLALAGIFFVQYGMEKGLLPPGLRVLAAMAFGAGLIAAGEWLRRKHGDEGTTPTVNLPSVFSGAGIVTIFAATLAARQLYGLIGPQLAFAGHLATAALAVALGWFSGPLLVAVGLVGATAAPFIVSGGSEAGDWLYAYMALIAAVGLAVDAVRRWRWVSGLAVGLGYLGAVLIQLGGASDAGLVAHLAAMVLLAVILPELRLIPTHKGPALLPSLAMGKAAPRPGFTVHQAMAAMLASSLGLFFLSSDLGDTAMLGFAALTALGLAALLWADRAEGLADLALPPVIAFLAALAMQAVDHGGLLRDFAAQALALRAPESAPPLTASIMMIMATLLTLAAAYRALRPGPLAVPFGLAAVLIAPLAAATLELLWQPALVLGPYPWALHIIGLAALITALALRFAKADAPDLRRAAYATLSALSLIALALFLLITKTALTLALAVLVAVSAALDRRFRLPEMSLFLQAGAAVLGYRLLADPGLDWALSAPLAQVLLAFGGAIAAMLAALWLLAPLPRPTAKAVAESAAAGLAAILANVLITRWLNTANGTHLETHWGLTLNAMPWLILMLMQLYRARIGGPLTKLRWALAALGGLIAGAGVGLAATAGNPLFTYSPDQTGALVQGPLIVDSLFLAYAIPGLILGLAAWKLPLMRHLRLGFAALGAALLALYAGLEIRRFWQGDWLGLPGVTQPELYTYTLALMLLGAGLLYQAIARRSAPLRRIAMAVIALVVAKVFLLDAAGLTGLTRVISFAGLGLSLAGLAWLNRWAGQAGEKG